MKIQKTIYETLPMGEYVAEIKSVTAEEGSFGPQLKFMFEIVEGDYAENHLIGWTSAKYNPKSKLWAWYHNALGSDADDNECDTDLMIGRKVRLALSVKAQEDGTERNKVEDILAMRKTKPAGQQPGKLHWSKVEPWKSKFTKLVGELPLIQEEVETALNGPVATFSGSYDEACILIREYAESVAPETAL